MFGVKLVLPGESSSSAAVVAWPQPCCKVKAGKDRHSVNSQLMPVMYCVDLLPSQSFLGQQLCKERACLVLAAMCTGQFKDSCLRYQSLVSDDGCQQGLTPNTHCLPALYAFPKHVDRRPARCHWPVLLLCRADCGCVAGPDLSGPTLCNLIERHQITFALGVPTVFSTMLQHWERTKERPGTSLTGVNVGGSAMPMSMLLAFERYGVECIHAWGKPPAFLTNYQL